MIRELNDQNTQIRAGVRVAIVAGSMTADEARSLLPAQPGPHDIGLDDLVLLEASNLVGKP
jgi:hypothetical protein